MARRILALLVLLFPMAVAAIALPEAKTVNPDEVNVDLTVTVGSDGACNYSTITQAAAMAAAADTLIMHVAKNIVINATQVIPGRAVALVGGYDNCSDTSASGHSVLSGSSFTGSVLKATALFTGSGAFDLTLVGIDVVNGVGTSGSQAGGITIDGPFNVLLVESYVQFNFTNFNGGGISIKGQAGTGTMTERTNLTLTSNSIVSNNTGANGGGIACNGRVRIQSLDSQIAVNTASGAGGGIYSQQCYVNLFEHGLFQGVISNTVTGASGAGGGIYASSGSVYVLGGQTKQSLIDSNNAESGGGIGMASGSLYLSDATVTNNTATTRGGGLFLTGSVAIVARTRATSSCHHSLRCSEISGNHVTTSTGLIAAGGAVYASGGSTRISGTFIENNQSATGRGMAVYVADAPGTNGGLDVNGLRINGSVIAANTTGGPAAGSDSSVVHIQNSSAELGFDTFSRNGTVPRAIYTPTVAPNTVYPIDIYGTIFDATSGFAADPGANGAVPQGDCNRLNETSSPFAGGSTRSTTLLPNFVNAAGNDYALGPGSSLVDWCDASFNFSSAMSAEGGVRPFDDPVFPALYGNYDLGGLERQPADILFKNGFQ